MCTYLNKTGATYHFRRMVPDDLLGHFKTERGNPRLEWKRSLGTKDRDEAKRLTLHMHQWPVSVWLAQGACRVFGMEFGLARHWRKIRNRDISGNRLCR